MSRRRGEFEHRTSIFEGAFRAWSHLGGLSPEELQAKQSSELDPLDHPIVNDSRMEAAIKDDRYAKKDGNPDRKIYPYEPLPRTGLSHPYVQAILSPWLGPDADADAIQLGLTTLRTWWQHRRKGESGSAVVALGSDKMRGVVDGYTRHFFNLAHCLVANDKEPPPRSLHSKTKELEKLRSKRGKKRGRDDVYAPTNTSSGLAVPNPNRSSFAVVNPEPLDDGLTQLERMHAAQRRRLTEDIGFNSAIGAPYANPDTMQIIDMKGKCVPGTLDLPGVINKVSARATQLAHRGGGIARSSIGGPAAIAGGEYGDPSTTPVVLVSENGDIQIAMNVDGITCSHCVKIVETVLKGCNGNRSPINGLLDAAADRALNRILIKIDQSSSAKRIAFEAARNLSMVGYAAKVKEMSIVNRGIGDKKATMDLGALSTAFEVVATTDPQDVFNWEVPCTCPDNGIVRDDCSRHSQMNTRIFDAFDTREKQVTEYMAGCGKKYGMDCTCGPDCRCKNCDEHCKSQAPQGAPIPAGAEHLQPLAIPFAEHQGGVPVQEGYMAAGQRESLYRAMRNPSILSMGAMRQMSLLSTDGLTFGRAMSGLSALSIDWENMEDFDVNVDHSAHINNSPNGTAVRVPTDGIAQSCAMMTGGECNCGPNCLCDGCPIHNPSSGSRRSSFRSQPGDSVKV